MIKLIASDMDGTLLNDKNEIHEEFYKVFQELKKQNIIFAAASGRQYYNLAKRFEKIKDDNYLNIFNSFSDILESLSSKVEEVILHQEYLEENMEYIGDDLNDIQDELFEEVSFDDL